MNGHLVKSLVTLIIAGCAATNCYAQGTVGGDIGVYSGISSEFENQTEKVPEVGLVYSGWILFGSREKEVRSLRLGGRFSTQQARLLASPDQFPWQYRMTSLELVSERILAGGSRGAVTLNIGAGILWVSSGNLDGSPPGNPDAARWLPDFGAGITGGLRGYLHIIGPMSLTGAVSAKAITKTYPFTSGVGAYLGFSLYIDNPPSRDHD